MHEKNQGVNAFWQQALVHGQQEREFLSLKNYFSKADVFPKNIYNYGYLGVKFWEKVLNLGAI